MIEFIEGKLVTINPTNIIVSANGLGYLLNTPNPYHWQQDIGQNIQVYCELVVREDAMTLYGFKSQSDKLLFLTLNRVSGIGPKSALSIMAADDNEGLVMAIDSGDSQYLTKFPGVGKKTASQMILDLKGELDFVDESIENLPKADHHQQVYEEILEALAGLGYSQREIKRVSKELEQASFDNTQAGLSFAFKLLLNK